MTVLAYTIVDVFTDTPLEGNSVAIFTDASGLEDSTMQRLARELNLSETVFALPAQDGGDARIRIFTPNSELPFAGHPTLGAAFVLAGDREQIAIETGAGTVPLTLQRAGGRVVFGRMSQPLPTLAPFDGGPELLAALTVERSLLPLEVYVNGPRTVMVGLEDELAVAALAPNMQALVPLAANICCFAPMSGGLWKVRVFGPALGVPEDPATGSAAGPLALHLARHGAIAFGQEIEIRQGAEILRPSVLHARVEGSSEQVEKIEVGGAAVIVAQGEFELR
jgi:trans-2,3-dihydro-3-hydroxyanthranilate isomerase